MISIITPTFNRKKQVTNSIICSLNLLKIIKGEIIVIDDCSNDKTYNYLLKKFKKEIKKKKIKVFRLKQNIGVTGAKNFGVKKSIYEWVVFMDSDDNFLPNIETKFKSTLLSLREFDLIFFRCKYKDSKKIIRVHKKNYELKFNDFLNNGLPGECMPVINRKKFVKNLYYESLRGCESITYLDMIYHGSKCYVSNLAVRAYNTSGDDRLSTLSNRFARSDHLYKFHLMHLKYINSMTLKKKTNTFIKMFFYFIFKTINDYT